jgi:hypothetical protein
MGSCGSEQEPVVGSCEHGNELLSPTKSRANNNFSKRTLFHVVS